MSNFFNDMRDDSKVVAILALAFLIFALTGITFVWNYHNHELEVAKEMSKMGCTQHPVGNALAWECGQAKQP